MNERETNQSLMSRAEIMAMEDRAYLAELRAEHPTMNVRQVPFGEKTKIENNDIVYTRLPDLNVGNQKATKVTVGAFHSNEPPKTGGLFSALLDKFTRGKKQVGGLVPGKLSEMTALSAKAVAMDTSAPAKVEVKAVATQKPEVKEVAEAEAPETSEGFGKQALPSLGISKALSGMVASITAALGGEETPAML